MIRKNNTPHIFKDDSWKKDIMFVVMALSSFAMVGAAYMDEYMESGQTVTIIWKLVMSYGLITFVRANLTTPYDAPTLNATERSKPSLRLLLGFLLALGPCVLNLLQSVVSAEGWNGWIGWKAIAYAVAVALLTAIWEELFYRKIGFFLLEEKGKLTLGGMMFLAAVFSAAHVVNFFFYPPLDVLLQIVQSFAFGMFAMGLYMCTGSIVPCIVSHFLANLPAWYFEYAPDGATRLFANAGDILIAGLTLYCIAAGVVMAGISGKLALSDENDSVSEETV